MWHFKYCESNAFFPEFVSSSAPFPEIQPRKKHLKRRRQNKQAETAYKPI
jgi:hypothetical protein